MPTRDVTNVTLLDGREDDAAIWTALQQSGVVLLTGAAPTAEAFEAQTTRFATRFRIHQDPSRARYNAADTTQGVAGGADAIALHAERAYLPARPELLFFCCLTPSSSGGATTVCDGAALFDTLLPADAHALDTMALLWRTNLPPRMWQRMWNTEQPEEAAQRLTEAIALHGESARVRHWFEHETMFVEYQSGAIATGWIGRRKAFANYLLLQAQESEGDGPRATQADGPAIPDDLLRRVAAAADAQTIDIAWASGDVALIDNTRCMHGRRAFAGGERRILVRMGDAQPRFRERSSETPTHTPLASGGLA